MVKTCFNFRFHPVIWKIVLLQSKMWEQSSLDMLIESESILFMCKNLSSVGACVPANNYSMKYVLLVIFWIIIKKSLQFLPFIFQFLAWVPRFSRRVCRIPALPEKGSTTSSPKKKNSCWFRKLQILVLCICTKILQRFLEPSC